MTFSANHLKPPLLPDGSVAWQAVTRIKILSIGPAIRAATFQPDWACPPGDTIADIIAQRRISLHTFAREIGTPLDFARRLTLGQAHIDPPLAEKLHRTLGPSAQFWLTREHQYRADVARLAALTVTASGHELVAKLPRADMRRFGWIEAATDKAKQLAACLQFFGVNSVQEWHRRYGGELAVAIFRTSPTYQSDPYAVAAWRAFDPLTRVSKGRVSARDTARPVFPVGLNY